MSKLWQKTDIKLNNIVEKFETSDDLIYDNFLAMYDVYGSIAHAKMLQKIGILNPEELNKILTAFEQMLKLIEEGEFELDLGDEDIHTKVENKLVEMVGESGKKIHTGRSRNDQVLLDLRLFTRDKILVIKKSLIDLANTYLNLAQKYQDIPMPGYTHMQKAMPSSVGLWLGSYAESLTDDLVHINSSFQLINQSPLGTGAGFGVDLPLDREMVADLLGFEKVLNNSIYAQSSRGKFEAIVVFSLMQIIWDLSRFSADVLLYTSSEYNFLTASDEIVTGSSIMPQKKNVDLAELVRSKISIIQGYLLQITNTTINLPSGYHRSIQDTKKPFMESLLLTENVIAVAKILLEGLTPNEQVLKQAMTPEIYAASVAYDLVKAGIPFREAYKKVGLNLDQIKDIDIQSRLKSSTHSGSTGNLNLEPIKHQLIKEEDLLNGQKQIIETKFTNLAKI